MIKDPDGRNERVSDKGLSLVRADRGIHKVDISRRGACRNGPMTESIDALSP